MNVPIGVIAFIAGWRIIPHTESGPAGKLDVLGLLLLPAGSAATVYGLSELGSGSSLGSPKVFVPIVLGVALSVIFCLHALRVERPLLDVRLYGNRVFAAASSTTFWLGAALFGAMILVPLYYQEVRGESVLVTGLLVGPQGLGMLMVMPFTGRLTERLGGGPPGARGRASCCASRRSRCASSARRPRSWRSRSCSLVRGVGIGLAFVPAMSVAFASMRPDQLSDATPQLNVVQRLGGAIGTTVLAVVLQRSERRRSTRPRNSPPRSAPPTRGRCALGAGADPVRAADARRAPGHARRGGRRRAGCGRRRDGHRAARRLTLERPTPELPAGRSGDLLKACDSGPAGAGGADPLCYIRSGDAGTVEAGAEPAVRAAQAMETSRR